VPARRAVAAARALPAAPRGKAPPTVVGYAVVWNRPSFLLDRAREGGRFRELVLPGAFTRALRHHKDILGLVEHDYARRLGSTAAGSLSVWEDATGLGFSLELPADAFGRAVAERVRSRALAGASIGFTPLKTTVVTRGGETYRLVREGRLGEVSLSPRPAYADAVIRLAPPGSAETRRHVRLLAAERGLGRATLTPAYR
jgi:HK97 family phage prohead protease